MKKLYICLVAISFTLKSLAVNYYVDAAKGNDRNNGRSPQTAFRSLTPLKTITFAAGDSIILAGGQRYKGMIVLESQNGSDGKPIVVTSRGKTKATIDGKGEVCGVLVSNCNHVVVENLHITANGGGIAPGGEAAMRYGVSEGLGRFGIVIAATKRGVFSDFTVRKLDIDSVYFNDPGFIRDAQESHTSNGTTSFGWGIRVISTGKAPAYLDRITIEECTITSVSHTGIRLSAPYTRERPMTNIRITGNKVTNVGGPGIVGESIRNVYIGHNTTDRTGSPTDNRNWKRGAGIWVWNADNTLIEHNRTTNANGPIDSHGMHIDFHSNNVVIQYNFSANNEGGFIEILGNAWNCAYRYNISVNDGWRKNDLNVQNNRIGKTIWLTGFVGARPKHIGPYYSYIYNNTIYVKSEIQAKVSVENCALGVLMANNIFYIEGDAIIVPGDEYNPAKAECPAILNVHVKNNLFLHKGSWSPDYIQDSQPVYGDPVFAKNGGLEIKDYIPSNKTLVKQGIEIERLPGDHIGLSIGLKAERDILGNPINGKPSMGAIQVE